MESFKIKLVETNFKTIDVEAKNIEEAIETAEDMYHNGEVIMDDWETAEMYAEISPLEPKEV